MRKNKNNKSYKERLVNLNTLSFLHLCRKQTWSAFTRHYCLVKRLDQVEAIERIRLNEKGLTLLEMLIAITLMSIIGLAFNSMLLGAARAKAGLNKTIVVAQQAQQNAANATYQQGMVRHCAYNEDCPAKVVLQCWNASNGRGERGDNDDDKDLGSRILLCSEQKPCLFENGVWYVSGEKGSRCHATKKTVCNMGVLVK